MGESVPPANRTSRLAFPGAVLAGKYRIEGAIGYGGMGSVWKATHTGLGEPVAIKLVAAEFVRSEEALRRFDTEAKAAAKIASRHVPHVFDNGLLEDGTPYLVMELLQGQTLFARIHREGPMQLPEAIGILDQCGRALTRAHSLGIVHRDIKPDNIFLAQSVDEDLGYIVKVLDFGIAKLVDAGDVSSTRTGAILGTPTFMSPEQARGIRSIDARTDLYSLGLVAFTMLTGNLAFKGETLGDLLLQICVEPLPDLCAAAPWLPPLMDSWFKKACARNPNDRFSTAREFVEGMRIAAGISAAPGSALSWQANPSVASGIRAEWEGATAQFPLPTTTGGASVALPAQPRGSSTRMAWAIAISLVLSVAGSILTFSVIWRGGYFRSLGLSQPSTTPRSVASPSEIVMPQLIPAPAFIAPSATVQTPTTPEPLRTSRGGAAQPSPVLPAVPAALPSTQRPAPLRPSVGPSPTKQPGNIDLGY